ncbi:MAG TPA: DUF4149 domain-containing protein [Albitalea sp.]
MPERFAAWLAGVWTGVLAAIGLIAAPAAFAVVPPQTAGMIAGRMFAREAYAGIAVAVVLFVILRRSARARAAAGTGSVLSADMLLVLGALFCTIVGYFAVLPMMASARAGQGTLSFGALHGISTGFFALKALLFAVLAWRLAPRAAVSPARSS